MTMKKILSMSLAGLLFTNSFSLAPKALNSDMKDIFNKPAVRTSTYCAGALAAFGILAGGTYGIYKLATYVPDDYLYQKLSQNLFEPAMNVTAEEWFKKLGGTQFDIDAYKATAERYDRGILTAQDNPNGSITFTYNAKAEETFDQIDKDVDRCGIPKSYVNQRSTLYTDFEKRCKRILKIYYYQNESAAYTQGWDYVLYMLFTKFAESTTCKCPEDEEAKIYFVYSKFIKMLNNRFGGSTQWEANYNNDYHKANAKGIKLLDNGSQFIDVIKYNIFADGLLTAGSYLFAKGNHINVLIKLFDIIISDDKFISPETHDFNEDFTCDQLNTAIYRMIYTNPDLAAYTNPTHEPLIFE